MGLIIIIINAIISVLTLAVVIYTLLRMILAPYHPVVNVLAQVIEPLFTPIRNSVPPINGLDFSPLILIIGLQVLGSLIVALLRSFV
ncbi:MAG: YggT family protein [Brevefilum sp.]